MDFCRVDRVTLVVALAVFDVLDQGVRLIEVITDQFYDVDIGHLIVAADVIDLAVFGVSDDQVDCLAVVFNVEPVTDIFSFTVDRERLISEGICYHQRDQLLRKLVRAIVIRAAAQGDRQAIGSVISHHEQVG